MLVNGLQVSTADETAKSAKNGSKMPKNRQKMPISVKILKKTAEFPEISKIFHLQG
jgi:hypothetical protein